MNAIKHYLLIAAGLSAMFLASTAKAQIAPFSNVVRISVAPRISDGTSNTIATLGQASDGSIALIVRSFDRRTGFQQGSTFSSGNFPPGQFPSGVKDVLTSRFFEPGSVFVLDSERRVHIFPLGFRTDGTPFLAAPVRVIGPLGPMDAGEGSVLGETPPRFQDDAGNFPVLGIGTMNGEVLLVTRAGGEVVSARFPANFNVITDLGLIPQVGYLALGAVRGGKLFLINPDDDSAAPGLQPRLVADLRDPRRIPLIDFDSDLNWALGDGSVRIVAAYGTNEIATLEIPPKPGFGETMTVTSVEQVSSPVRQVVFGSLTWLPVDGSGVLYNKDFTLEDGLIGRIWTVAGASMQFDPETLNLRSRGRFVTATIEAENNLAAEIDIESLVLSVDDVAGAVALPSASAAELVDADGDRNVDLKVKFERASLEALLAQSTGNTAIVRASWLYTDGTSGTASAQLRLIR